MLMSMLMSVYAVLIINHITLKRCQFVVRRRNKPFSKSWSLGTPDISIYFTHLTHRSLACKEHLNMSVEK